jgi:hypothetical protein
MRAARGQFEKLVRALVLFVSKHNCPSFAQVSTRIEQVEKVRCELYASWTFTMHTCQLKSGILVDSASLTQDYSTGYAQDLDEIRAILMTITQRLQALSVRHVYLSCCWLRLCLLSAGSRELLFPMSLN